MNKQEKPFDSTKPFQLRRGARARLLGRINDPEYPLVVEIQSQQEPTREMVRYYNELGNIPGLNDTDEDLVNIPNRVKRTKPISVADFK